MGKSYTTSIVATMSYEGSGVSSSGGKGGRGKGKARAKGKKGAKGQRIVSFRGSAYYGDASGTATSGIITAGGKHKATGTR